MNQGSVHFLIMRTKNLNSDFDEYEEEINKITVERAIVALYQVVVLIAFKN